MDDVAVLALVLAASVGLTRSVAIRPTRRGGGRASREPFAATGGAPGGYFVSAEPLGASDADEERAYRLSRQLLGYAGEGLSGTITAGGMEIVARALAELAPNATRIFDFGIGTGTAVMNIARAVPGKFLEAYGVEVAEAAARNAVDNLKHVPLRCSVFVGEAPPALEEFGNVDFSHDVMFSFSATIPPDAKRAAVEFAGARFKAAAFVDRAPDVRNLEVLVQDLHAFESYLLPDALRMMGGSGEVFRALVFWRIHD